MQTELFGVDDEPRMRRAIDVRVTVFVDEQCVPIEMEIDDHDRDDRHAVHAILLDGNSAVGAGRFYVRDDGETIQIGRMAVLPSHRGRGAGRLLLHARPFYEKYGFTAEGPLFEDAGITHQEMIRDL